MADIWEQFHALPKAIRDAVASPAAITAIDEVERLHPGLDLANFVMRVMVHEFPVNQLAAKMSQEQSLALPEAQQIAQRLERDVFSSAAEYLGIQRPTVPPPSPTPPRPAAPPPNLPVAAVPPVRSTTPSTPPPSTLTKPQVVLPPPSPAPAAPTGSVAPTQAYSDDDAREIAHQAERIKALTPSQSTQDFDELARSVLKQQNLAFSDDLLNRRAVAIIKARLKDIRKTEQTKDMLSRDPKIGGLGLDPDLAGIVAEAAEHEAKQLKERGMLVAPEPVEPPLVPVVPMVTQERPAPMPPLQRVEPATPAPGPVIPNVTEVGRPSRPIIRPADIPPPPPLTPPAKSVPPTPVKPLPPTTVVQPMRGADRPTMSDIRRPTKTLGPAEEIKSMTISDFRRLGQGAADSAKKLHEKFQHLQRESFGLWAEAVAGWRQSDIYQLYLSMGRESLERGVPISQIITDRGRSGQPYLSEHEFLTISDFNRQLQV
ncbi:MAG: hypothetical protein HY975_04645 [Candidatus Kerfeldbacteria bacterium]|nr:hypothetical protein [Candidatus Kerfeldbacteria bacterium]